MRFSPQPLCDICKNKLIIGNKNIFSSPKAFVMAMACMICLMVCPTVFADGFFGFGVSDGDRKLTWLDNDVSVSDEMNRKYDYYWKTKEEDTSDIDYQAYVKTFKLYMLFKQNF